MTDFRQVARKAARKYGLDPNVFERQINQESGFQNLGPNGAGAEGIAQFIPSTAKGLGVDPMNPTQSLDGAAKLMASYVKKYGSYRDALVAYNAGPARVGKPLYAETRQYLANILQGHEPTSTPTNRLVENMASRATQTPAAGTGAPQAASSTDAMRQALLSKVLTRTLGANNPLTLDTLSASSLPGGTVAPTTVANSVVRTTGAPTQLSPSGYVAPWSHHSKVADGRIDEGTDPTIANGHPIRAIGNAKVVALHHNFYGSTPYLVYELLDGPRKGQRVYVSEYFNPTVKPGQRVRAGQAVGTGTGRAIETGWAGGAQGNWLPLANKAQGGNYTEGAQTNAGKDFARFLQSLGARG